MREEYDFRELFQVLAKQYWLAPEIAESLLERILEILSQNDSEVKRGVEPHEMLWMWRRDPHNS